MNCRLGLTTALALALASFLAPPANGDDPENVVSKLLGGELEEQTLLSIEIIVKDADDQPVEDAEVSPWALRSSLGHGRWDEKRTDTKPQSVKTDADGKASVLFPKFAFLEEQVATTAVSISIDHPDHPYIGSEHVKITTRQESPHEVTLPRGSAIEVSISVDGHRDSSDKIFALWSGGRSWRNNGLLEATDDGTFRIPPLAEGTGQFLFVRLEDELPTHFSLIEDVKIDGKTDVIHKETALKKAASVRGRFSDNVPRPVSNGRVSARTIPSGENYNDIEWFTWAPVEEDGTFVIDAWPSGEPIQLVALCDGFMAEQGDKPEMVKPKRATGGYRRAQVFVPPHKSEVEIDMIPTVSCSFEIVNAFDKPLEGVIVGANPNVGWWNSGSQIYCWPLVRGAEFLRERESTPWRTVRGYMPCRLREYRTRKANSRSTFLPGTKPFGQAAIDTSCRLRWAAAIRQSRSIGKSQLKFAWSCSRRGSTCSAIGRISAALSLAERPNDAPRWSASTKEIQSVVDDLRKAVRQRRGCGNGI